MVAQSSSQPKVSDTSTYRDHGHPCSKDLSRPWRRATELTPNQSLQPTANPLRGLPAAELGRYAMDTVRAS